MKITVEAFVRVDLDKVWAAWNNPADIVQWNAADEYAAIGLATPIFRTTGSLL